MATATLGGIEIHYEVDGDGPAVLLSHGYSATLRMWDGQRAALEPGYRLITWDMRGHGSTASPADAAAYSAERTVEDMRGLLDLIGVEKAVIGGLSLGGYMSLAFHRAHPERVSALVICDSGPGYRNPDARAKWNELAGDWARNLQTKGLEYLRERSSEMRQAIRVHRSVEGLIHAAHGMLAQKDSSVIDSLPTIAAPTLIIVGDRDEPFLAPSRYMAAKIPGARLEIIQDAGHSANLDQPEAFNRVLLDFLKSISS